MPFQIKPLSCDPARIKGMSERLIISHYDNNYGGAVKRLNVIEGELSELDYDSADAMGAFSAMLDDPAAPSHKLQ
jgi:superoxide dismutase, Fe-Mn family